MKKKLIEKGFTYDAQSDFFEGEFNGHDVQLFIVTNNNKVYRIMLCDALGQDEANIKIRFNILVAQFEKSKKYLTLEEQAIPDEDDISYEMSVHNKIYEAIFYQKPLDYKDVNIYTQKQAEEQAKALEPALKKAVWFRICENYGKYYIAMFYDNKYNGERGVRKERGVTD